MAEISYEEGCREQCSRFRAGRVESLRINPLGSHGLSHATIVWAGADGVQLLTDFLVNPGERGQARADGSAGVWVGLGRKRYF